MTAPILVIGNSIGSLSFYFFPLVQAGASVKKRESDKQKKPGIDFQKATCSKPALIRSITNKL